MKYFVMLIMVFVSVTYSEYKLIYDAETNNYKWVLMQDDNGVRPPKQPSYHDKMELEKRNNVINNYNRMTKSPYGYTKQKNSTFSPPVEKKREINDDLYKHLKNYEIYPPVEKKRKRDNKYFGNYWGNYWGNDRRK